MKEHKPQLMYRLRWVVAIALPFLPIVLAIVYLTSEEGSTFPAFLAIVIAICIGVTVMLWTAFFVAPGVSTFNKGRAAFLNRDMDKAVTYLGQSVQTNGKFWAARTLLAQALIARKDYEAALSEANKVLEAQKRNVPVYRVRAAIYIFQKNYEAAATDIEEIIRLKSKQAGDYGMLAMCQIEQKKYREAIENAQKSLELDKTHSPAAFVIGMAYFKTKDFDKAVKAFDLAIRLAPTIGLYFMYRGQSFRQLKQYDLAFQDMNHAVELWPSCDSYYQRGLLYLKVNNHALGLADFESAVQMKPDEYVPYIGRGYAHLLLDDYDTAKADFEHSLTCQENAYAYCNLSEIHLFKGEYGDAIKGYQKAIELMPELEDSVMGLALGHFLWGDVEKAREIWAGLVKDEPRFQEVEWVIEEYVQHPKMADLIRRLFAEGQITNPPTA